MSVLQYAQGINWHTIFFCYNQLHNGSKTSKDIDQQDRLFILQYILLSMSKKITNLSLKFCFDGFIKNLIYTANLVYLIILTLQKCIKIAFFYCFV